jgi:hypothetical protein
LLLTQLLCRLLRLREAMAEQGRLPSADSRLTIHDS